MILRRTWSIALLFTAILVLTVACTSKPIDQDRSTDQSLTGKVDTFIVTTDLEEFPIYVYSQWNKLNWIVFPNDTLLFLNVGKPIYSYNYEDKLLEITNYHTAAAFAYLSSPESPRKPIQLSQQLIDFASLTKQQLSHTQLKKWFPYYFFEADSNLRAFCYYADLDFDDTNELIVDLVHPKVVYRYYSLKRGSDYYLTAKSVLYHEFSCEHLSTDPHPESGLVWVNEYSSSSCGGYCVLSGKRFHQGKVVRIGGFVVDQYLDSSCAMEQDENTTVWELKSSIKSQTRNQVIITATYSEHTYNKKTPNQKTYLFKNKKIDLVFNWNSTKGRYEWDNSQWPSVKDLPLEASEFSQLVHKR